MKLTPDQIAQFDRDGYLFFPGLFTPQEMKSLNEAVPALTRRRDAFYDLTTTSYPLWTLDHALVAQLVERAGGKHGGIVSPLGPAGSMIVFHSCLVHASSSNLSPWNRVSVYLSLCAVSNHIRRFKRPEYIAQRDFTPIACLPDDCLLREHPVELPWKNGMPASALVTSPAEI